MAFCATYFGANGWELRFGEHRVLLDPWLRGPLVFAGATWLFRGDLPQAWPVPRQVALLLLTQGLPDHAHPPSLQGLDRSIPVVASPAAATVVRALGFQQVSVLRPGNTIRHSFADADVLELEATAGAPVPRIENGYLLRHASGRVYAEPHGYLQGDLAAERLDAVITPVLDLALPLAGAFVRGQAVLPQLLERFSPRWVLASTAGGDVRYAGLLERLLRVRGSLESAERTMAAMAPGSRLLKAIPGRCYDLSAA